MGEAANSNSLWRTRVEGFQNSVTVIIPTLNEGKSIATVILELKHLGFSNIVVIDGNSEDDTVDVAERLGVNVIHQNGSGKGDAMRQAFGDTEVNGEVILVMDADGSMNPKEAFSFLEAIQNGVDCVKGSRFLPGAGSEDLTLFRRIGSSFFVFLVNTLWSTKYTDLCYGFAAFKRKALEKLYPHLESKNFEIETEIFIKAKKLGLKVGEIPSVELRRTHGKSNLKALKDGLRILKTIVQEFVQNNNIPPVV